MRPGLVFIGLFVLLVGVYFLLADALGEPLIYVLQGAIVLALLGEALWCRRKREAEREKS